MPPYECMNAALYYRIKHSIHNYLNIGCNTTGRRPTYNKFWFVGNNNELRGLPDVDTELLSMAEPAKELLWSLIAEMMFS